MPLITWNEKYSVNIDKIDVQHQKLIQLLNNLYDAMRLGKGKDIINKTLDELIEYTQYHFKYEEELFDKYSYVDKVNHIKEHNALKEKVMAIKEKVKVNHGATTIEILNMLKDWINTHISSMDKEYAKVIAPKLNGKDK